MVQCDKGATIYNMLMVVPAHKLEKEMATDSSILSGQNSTDRRAWWTTVYGVAKSQT